jgi:hypothetical protein
MFFWAIIFPIIICYKQHDPRFSVFRVCQNTKKYLTMRNSESHPDGLSQQSGGTAGSQTENFPNDQSVTEISRSEAPLSEEQHSRLRTVPLSKFLTSHHGRESFRTFTQLEFSIENLLFVEAVEALAARAHTPADVRKLYEEYVQEGSTNQVNLPAVTREKVDARFRDSEQHIDVFEEAVRWVYKLMQGDTYKRFQRTSVWERVVVEFDTSSEGAGEPNKAAPASGSAAPVSGSATPAPSNDVELTVKPQQQPEPSSQKREPEQASGYVELAAIDPPSPSASSTPYVEAVTPVRTPEPVEAHPEVQNSG